jgi:hypothetical protein
MNLLVSPLCMLYINLLTKFRLEELIRSSTFFFMIDNIFFGSLSLSKY